jgi:hypothetical protein
VDLKEDLMIITTEQALERPIPLAIWDVDIIDFGPFEALPMRALDDGRTVTVLEVPAGWSGRCELALQTKPANHVTRCDGRWMMQSFGEGDALHTYLYLDAPLTKAVEFLVNLKQATRVDDAKGLLGKLEAGKHSLTFGPLQGWYRFWGCCVEDLQPAEGVEALIDASGALVGDDAGAQTARHFEALDAKAWAHPSMVEKSPMLTVHCGAKLAYGTRSRAAAHDDIVAHLPRLHASEFADGVMAFGPGQAFWYHPRGLHFRIYGLGEQLQAGERGTLLLHSFDPQKLSACYKVEVGPLHRSVGKWNLPESSDSAEAFFPVEFSADDLDSKGRLTVSIGSDQKALVHWWREGGFIAAIHALWVGR